jgi:hypothetical protein
MAVSFGTMTVYSILDNWQLNPVIVTIDDDSYPLTAVEFPSIIICPSVKVETDKLIAEVCRLE